MGGFLITLLINWLAYLSLGSFCCGLEKSNTITFLDNIRSRCKMSLGFFLVLKKKTKELSVVQVPSARQLLKFIVDRCQVHLNARDI